MRYDYRYYPASVHPNWILYQRTAFRAAESPLGIDYVRARYLNVTSTLISRQSLPCSVVPGYFFNTVFIAHLRFIIMWIEKYKRIKCCRFLLL